MTTTAHTRPTQTDRVLAYLKANPKGLTARECSRKLNIDRLAARIHEIPLPILKTWVRTKGGANVIRYSLAPVLA